MRKFISISIAILTILLVYNTVKSQSITHKKTNAKWNNHTDSLKATKYPYHFPVLGDKVRKMGFDIPLPNGFMVTAVRAEQQIAISDLSVSLTDAPGSYINVDSIVTFGSLTPVTNSIQGRYDIWLLPFFNVSLLGGYVNTDTDVELVDPFTASFMANTKGPNVGFGVLFAGGAGPIIGSVDYNQVWTFVKALKDPAIAKTADIRAGHLFKFRKPGSELSLMAGASWLRINPFSQGSENLTELFGFTQEQKDNAVDELDDWYAGLPPGLQDRFTDLYDAMRGFLERDEDRIIYYQFNKRLLKEWSMVLVGNYQINPRFNLTLQYTFLGSRDQLVLGLGYRFGIKGPNLFAGKIGANK